MYDGRPVMVIALDRILHDHWLDQHVRTGEPPEACAGDPVTLWPLPFGGMLWIRDGRHRVAQAIRAGQTTIHAVIVK
jgi:hypothetical protein